MPFQPHPDRAAALAEVHARPFHPIETPCRVLLFAFMTDAAQAAADRAALAGFCRARNAAEPAAGAKHHRVAIEGGTLRWEQHAEFTTYSWELNGAGEPFAPLERGALMAKLPQPGPHLASVDLHMLPFSDRFDPAASFDPNGTAMSAVYRDEALVATDFKADDEGFVRILVLDRGVGPNRAGSLMQRLLEIETYRMLALLGLPEAMRAAPGVAVAEESLARIGADLSGGQTDDHKLLDELTELAAKLETDSSATSFRFRASRAYHEIVQQRLEVIGETPILGFVTLNSFMARRVAPAMRTCQMLEDRQANLAAKLTRAANLLRTRVDVEIEKQNRDLLASMNSRAKLQLRLQQTVEGLSVAAISYYVVGLAAYLLKGVKEKIGLPVSIETATAITVPVAVIAVGLVVHRVRKSHEQD